MTSLVIFIPRTEASFALLRNLLPTIIRRFRKVALPLPREYCTAAIMDPNQALNILSKLGGSFVRLWGWFPKFFRDLIAGGVDAYFHCYDDMNRLRNAVNVGIEIARLVLRYRLGAATNINDWLIPFKKSALVNINIKDIGRYDVVIVDDYSLMLSSLNDLGSIITLGPLVPTPIDLLALISIGRLSEDNLSRVVSYVTKYIGDYVIMSRDLTEAFSRLVSDSDYLSFVRSLGLLVVL
ncbi:MAG: hypothetical protein ACP5GY_03350 [Vulcanisaeta sp.]